MARPTPTAAGPLPVKSALKDVSRNGKAQPENDRKAKKDLAPVALEGKKAAGAEPEKPAPPPVKTYLSAKELKEFKAMLLEKRAELAGDVERLTSEALNRKSGGVNEQSTMPIHMADLGTDTWEQDFTLGLIANEQALVREIDDALARIEDKTYGMCVATDKPISKERLRAKPWAKYCIEYARLREEGRAP
jgi:RNA polymerase-binding protein DksA